MNNIISFLFLVSMTFLLSCTKQAQEKVIYKIEVDQIAQEQQIPKNLLAELDAELAEEFKSSPPLYTFIPITVGFVEDQSGVLIKPHIEYTFPKGGGALDFKDIIADTGSFYMFFPQEQFSSDHQLLHIYYISQSPIVEIDGEKFGLGCGKWNDIKASFKKLQKQDYLKLNTTQNRYLHVTAGTYIFVFKHNKNIYLTQITLTDSRHKDHLCGAIQ